jgi:hypothetical protein
MNIDELKNLHFALSKFAHMADDAGFSESYHEKRRDALEIVLDAVMAEIIDAEISGEGPK